MHVSQTEYRSSKDSELVELAKSFDVFVTLDLHRQEAEWLAVNRALVDGGIKVVRIRLPKKNHDPLVDVLRSLIYKMETWVSELESGHCLVILGELGQTLRARSPDDVLKMLEARGC